MSKSGLYAHFGSKQQLQLDVIHAARVIFEREVIEPALAVAEGRPRLEALCESYLAYIENWVFPGGCFFAGMLAEFDAQTGPPHQAINEDQRDWTDLLESQVVQAQINENSMMLLILPSSPSSSPRPSNSPTTTSCCSGTHRCSDEPELPSEPPSHAPRDPRTGEPGQVHHPPIPVGIEPPSTRSGDNRDAMADILRDRHRRPLARTDVGSASISGRHQS